MQHKQKNSSLLNCTSHNDIRDCWPGRKYIWPVFVEERIWLFIHSPNNAVVVLHTHNTF